MFAKKMLNSTSIFPQAVIFLQAVEFAKNFANL
ncbi:hypothetical protein L280_10690 [Mannheimia haemolytica MhBrain2012]|nr:hypothetical protein F382_11860 [Mannheimia haemolytica D153]AGQ39578.1 hypothetical protein J450_10835 [Mannheimia haemolytica D171]AGQ42145.1 hypothetical protein J451_11975 [Mannheimia haemolytica D174]AGR74543.1 hypothetical protein N220_03985 [Mannheimia haemolytica USMARC_2286]EPZ01277.1 hypothetical protein L279_03120 [Mannheimia haemolytica D38]EPZ22989.1 hypothetical protein L277_05405 [Mannheimia haemolytica D193]EPZ24714.1 hypothetical protein L281_04565 [Mannheimia haemolytica 